jgi:hypothetical protein
MPTNTNELLFIIFGQVFLIMDNEGNFKLFAATYSLIYREVGQFTLFLSQTLSPPCFSLTQTCHKLDLMVAYGNITQNFPYYLLLSPPLSLSLSL